MAIIKVKPKFVFKFIKWKPKTTKKKKKGLHNFTRRVLSISLLLKRTRRRLLRNFSFSIKPIIAPKSFVIILKEKPRRATYNERIIDYKNCVFLQNYIGLGGKILRRQRTKLSSKNQRFIAKTIKTSRMVSLLPFVSKEKGFFR
jgi:ribosomal protein S18